MKCPRCGKENKPNVSFCEACGLKFEQNPAPKQIQPVRRPVNNVPPLNMNIPAQPPKKRGGLKIWQIILITVGSVFAGIGILLIFLIIVGLSMVDDNSESNRYDTKSTYSYSSRVEETTEPVTAKQEAEKYWKNYCDENYSDIIEVSISHLHDNADYYNNKTILTVAKIDELNTDSFSTNVQNDKLFFDGAKFDFKQYNDELEYYGKGETVIVVGNVDSKSSSWADVCVKDCHIIGSGETASDKAKELNSLDYSYETTAPPTTLSDSDIETKKKNAESQYAKDYSDIDATEIEINRLYDNKDDYIGKTILTAVKIESLDDDNFNVDIQNGSSIFYDVEFRFKEYSDELEYYKNGDFVIVYGTVKDDTSSWSSLCVTDCHIIGSGDEAKKKAQELT